MVGCQVLSRPSAAEGGGRRPAFTGPATQPYSATEVDGWQQLSRVSQNRAAVQIIPSQDASADSCTAWVAKIWRPPVTPGRNTIVKLRKTRKLPRGATIAQE